MESTRFVGGAAVAVLVGLSLAACNATGGAGAARPDAAPEGPPRSEREAAYEQLLEEVDPFRVDGTSTTLCGFSPLPNSIAPNPAPGLCISGPTPCVTVPVDIHGAGQQNPLRQLLLQIINPKYPQNHNTLRTLLNLNQPLILQKPNSPQNRSLIQINLLHNIINPKKIPR